MTNSNSGDIKTGAHSKRVTYCTEHCQTVGDDSPRGEVYPDDRTELACVYDGLSLRAVLFDEREVERYREETNLTVTLTPAGECRIDGRCVDTGTEGSK